MADPTGQQTSDSSWRLAAAPFAFDFFRAARLIECGFLKKPRVGESLSPRDDAVRFGQMPSLAFAPSTLAGFQPAQDERPENYLLIFWAFSVLTVRCQCTLPNTPGSGTTMPMTPH